MRVATLALTVCLALMPAGCQVWSSTPLAPTTKSGIQGNPKIVRLTLADSTQITLRNPEMRNDSISGLIIGGKAKGTRISFSRSQVRRLDHPHLHPVAVVLGAVAEGLGRAQW